MPRSVEIEEDVYEFIQGNIRTFRETESTVLRRLLNIPEASSKGPLSVPLNSRPSPLGGAGKPGDTLAMRGSEMTLAEKIALRRKQTQMHDGAEALATAPLSDTQSPPAVLGETPLMRFIANAAFRRRNATNQFLGILGFAFGEHSAEFDKVLDEVSGRSRKYFGRSAEEIKESGTSTHPRPIPGSPFWAMTNADTRQKRDVLTRVLEVLGYSREEILAADRAII